MSQEIQKAEHSLPTIRELRDDQSLEIRGKENDLNVLLNQQPDEKWIKGHPFISVKDDKGNKVAMPYLPVERLEWLMTRIFVKWYREVIRVDLITNAVAVTLRLHYVNPVTGQWEWTDGVGASAMQVNKDASPTDFTQMKSSAVEMGLPKAKTEAFKDAAGDLGRLFGRDLNRKNQPEYNSMIDQFPMDSFEVSVLEMELAKVTRPEFRKDWLDWFKVDSIEEIPKSKFKTAKARIMDAQ